MTTDVKLLPCPFQKDIQDDHAVEAAYQYKSGDGIIKLFAVECSYGCRGPVCSTMEEAIAAWNTRAEPPTQREKIEECKYHAFINDKRYEFSEPIHGIDLRCKLPPECYFGYQLQVDEGNSANPRVIHDADLVESGTRVWVVPPCGFSY